MHSHAQRGNESKQAMIVHLLALMSALIAPLIALQTWQIFDGDGDLDLLIGENGGNISYHQNNGLFVIDAR